MEKYINNGGVVYDGATIGENVIINNFAIVYPGTNIGANSVIESGAIIYPGVILGENVHIGPYCVIGEHAASYYKEKEKYKVEITKIGNNSIIRSNAVIYEGSIIGNDFQSGHHVTIREKSIIGDNCSLGTFSDIQGKVKIGNFVRMHSNVHIGQLTTIEDYAWLFPYVMTTNDMYPPHDKLEGCTIKKYAIVGASTTIMPGKTIGQDAFVAAGSLVSKNISDGKFALGRPAKEVKNASEIKDENGNLLYPWENYLEENRGYPWQLEKKKTI